MMDWTHIDRDIETKDYGMIANVAIHLRGPRLNQGSDFSEENHLRLRDHILKLKNCEAILEIGVENNPDASRTSTRTIFDTKKDETFYFGIDILDRSHLDNPAKNIYTLIERGENIDSVMNFVFSKKVKKLDFIFIDGWHSINQVEREFAGYTPYLTRTGIVGWHDSNHHFGPKWLTETIDRQDWYVAEFPGDPEKDFGISFAWRR